MQEFNEQFYTRFHRDQKRKKFFRLKQFGKTIIEYETKLRELADFFLELANFEEYLCSKFEKGLSLEIREKISVSSSQSYKEVMQLALRVKKLSSERRSRGSFQKRMGLGFLFGQSSKKSHNSEYS